jgi:hypothetical protein
VRKLKRRLPSPEGSDAGSYVPTGGRRNEQDDRGNQSSINDTFISALTATTEAFTGAMKLTTNKPGSQSWPTFDGSYKEFYAFKREYELHLGNRTDIGDDMKASLLKLNCLKGKLRDEFKNYTRLNDIWKVLNNRYDQPALFVELVLKDIREHRKIRDGDSQALNIFYNQLLSARMELNQHGLAGELNSAIVLRELTSKLPAMELERWLREKPDRPNCAIEFFLFVEKREAITAKVMAEMLAQAPLTAKGQESSKTKDSQDSRKMKAVAHAAVAAATNPAPAKPFQCLAVLLDTLYGGAGY